MKKRFGFTLTEVLITLTIIGVIAALTTPSLIKKTGQAKIGPSLSKFVNTFDNAAQKMMNDRGVTRLSQVSGAFYTPAAGANPASGLFEVLSRYIAMVYIPVDNFPAAPASMVNEIPLIDNNRVFQLKDGSIVYICPASIAVQGTGYDRRGSYRGTYAGAPVIFYDIDGFRGKNTLGKDVFAFLVDDSGSLIPYGGNVHTSLNGETAGEYGTCSVGAADDNAMACTGAVADNGWKADY